MTTQEFLRQVAKCRLVASVQATDGTSMQMPEVLAALAAASQSEGVAVLRLQGAEAIAHVRQSTGLVTIGLIKRQYEGSDVYITPTLREVDEAADAGAEVVALDGTARRRPSGAEFQSLVEHARRRGMLVLADIDTVESARFALAAGTDFLSTTLAGYTGERLATEGPDLDLLREVVTTFDVPVFAEGRIQEAWHVEAALRIGAVGVIVGGALNDPHKNTRRLLPAREPDGLIGAVDIGGTWLRFGVFDGDTKLVDSERVPNPPTRNERLSWIRAQVQGSGVCRLGVGSGGIIDPRTGECWAAKEYLMPDQIGIRFDEETFGVPTFAHGDGHATAWGHACLPRFSGRRVATLTLGTGVGCGFVQEQRIWSGRRGEYPRINDLPAPGGGSYEDLLGGLNLGIAPADSQRERAAMALEGAVQAIRDLYFPDDIVVSGTVGMSDWLLPRCLELGLVPSPYGSDAGLYGAAALAAHPRYL